MRHKGQQRVEKNNIRIIGPESFSLNKLPLRALVRPQGGDVHLWHLDLGLLASPLNSFAPVDVNELSEVQHRATRRFYLRLLLGAYLGLPGKDVRITRRVKGRPELDPVQSNGELNFSVARSGGCYLIGVSGGAIIGVDMEEADRSPGKPMALARRYFSQQEISDLAGLGEEKLRRSFMHTWACKEAIVKASGVGIANQLCRFSVDVDPDRPPSVLDMPDDDPGAWKLALAKPVTDAIAVVAVRQPEVLLEGFSLSR